MYRWPRGSFLMPKTRGRKSRVIVPSNYHCPFWRQSNIIPTGFIVKFRLIKKTVFLQVKKNALNWNKRKIQVPVKWQVATNLSALVRYSVISWSLSWPKEDQVHILVNIRIFNLCPFFSFGTPQVAVMLDMMALGIFLHKHKFLIFQRSIPSVASMLFCFVSI
jgi:hypothetical protein